MAKDKILPELGELFKLNLRLEIKSRRILENIRFSEGDHAMKIYWISLLSLLALVVTSCGSHQADEKDPNSPSSTPQEVTSPKFISSSSENNSPPPQLPEPTTGSVVITNTTVTPALSTPPNYMITPDPAFENLAQQAKEDLATRLNIDIDQIVLLKVVPAKWPYDSVGCPLSKTKSANVPEYQILLKADDQIYMYHTDGDSQVGICNVKLPTEIRSLP